MIVVSFLQHECERIASTPAESSESSPCETPTIGSRAGRKNPTRAAAHWSAWCWSFYWWLVDCCSRGFCAACRKRRTVPCRAVRTAPELRSSARAAARGRKIRILGIHREELSHHAIGPPETILQRVFAAPTAAAADDIVFLDQFAVLPVEIVDVRHPAARNRRRERRLTVVAQS